MRKTDKANKSSYLTQDYLKCSLKKIDKTPNPNVKKNDKTPNVKIFKTWADEMEVAGTANELIDDNFHTSFCQSLDKTVISVMTTIKFQHTSTAITTYGFYSQEATDYMADNNYAEDFDLVAGNNATYIGSEYWSFRGRRNTNTVFYDYTYFSSPSPICLMLLNTQHSQPTPTQIPQHTTSDVVNINSGPGD